MGSRLAKAIHWKHTRYFVLVNVIDKFSIKCKNWTGEHAKGGEMCGDSDVYSDLF